MERQEIVLYLLEKGVSINSGVPLHFTTEPIYAKFLVDHGADPFVLQASRYLSICLFFFSSDRGVEAS